MAKLISVVKDGVRKDLTVDELNGIVKGGPGSGRHPYGTGAQTYFSNRISNKTHNEKMSAMKDWKHDSLDNYGINDSLKATTKHLSEDERPAKLQFGDKFGNMGAAIDSFKGKFADERDFKSFASHVHEGFQYKEKEARAERKDASKKLRWQ